MIKESVTCFMLFLLLLLYDKFEMLSVMLGAVGPSVFFVSKIMLPCILQIAHVGTLWLICKGSGWTLSSLQCPLETRSWFGANEMC